MVMETMAGKQKEVDEGSQRISLELKGKNLPRSTRSDFPSVTVNASC